MEDEYDDYENFLDVDEKNATFLQHALASVGGATASITVAQPLDVIKTRYIFK